MKHGNRFVFVTVITSTRMVALEAEIVYPADWLPDEPRVLAHRCSHGLDCNLDGRSSCLWSGTNPVIDPFVEL